MRAILHRLALRGLLVVLETTSLVCAFRIAAVAAAPQEAKLVQPVHGSETSVRLANLEEGRRIVKIAWQAEQAADGTRDCSHLVHQIYAEAGFEYPYASSRDIYAGSTNFERVKAAHAGDVIAWPGHVGIVVDPLRHRFYSLVRTGLETQDYESPYWRSRGRPRFYRYKVEREAMVTAANTGDAPRDASGYTPRLSAMAIEERPTASHRSSNRPPTAASEKSGAIYGPPAPDGWSESTNVEAAFEVPASVIVAAGNKPPTREEVAEGISELSEALGSALRIDDSLKNQRTVVIFERFSVDRVDIKQDHGWARLAVDSKVLIGGGAAQVKHRREKVRWELRRTESGWEAVTPTDRTYVPRDAAVKNLAATLARLAESDGAAKHEQAVLQQESRVAALLNALLENKQDH